MRNFTVYGMSCAACSARVEKAVGALPGIETCEVNLLMNSMRVSGETATEDIISAVKKAGYSAVLQDSDLPAGADSGEKTGKEPGKDFGKDPEKGLGKAPGKGSSSAVSKSPEDRDSGFKKALIRLTVSAVTVMLLMYISMGITMFGMIAPEILLRNPFAGAFIQAILAAAVIFINRNFFVSGFKGLIHGSANMDTLIAMGSGISFVWSMVILVREFAESLLSGMLPGAVEGLYFDSAAMILVFISIGRLLEMKAKGKTTDAIRGLMNLAPETALKELDGEVVEIPAKQLCTGDTVIVKSGMNISVDGQIINGSASINEASITGESIPKDVSEGDRVISGTTCVSGYLKVRAEKVGKETTLAQIIRTVTEASASKAPIARLADRVAGVFVPVVGGISLVTLIVWLVVGGGFGHALARAISVLVISCPCALGLATPVSIMVGNGIGARNGILYKTAVSLEKLSNIKILALDKTGTVTEGKMHVTDITNAEQCSKNDLINFAYAVESMSSHPIAQAICDEARRLGAERLSTENFTEIPGKGISGTVNGHTIYAGNMNYIASVTEKSAEETKNAERTGDGFAEAGKTPVYFAADGRLIGVIAVADRLRAGTKEAIKEFEKLGIRTVMLTGDNQATAAAIAAEAGISEFRSGILPIQKAEEIEELRKSGITAMVGDGINDAPALVSADIGIAVGAGTDIAIDSADIVIMNSELTDVAKAVRISAKTLLNIKENLFWAFCYNVIGIPAAAGVFEKLWGISLNPMWGAAAMSISSVLVVSNALRLNLMRFGKNKPDRSSSDTAGDIIADSRERGEEKMASEIVLNVSGMMCEHCERHVKNALEAIGGVAEAHPDHNTGKVVVKLEKEVSFEVMKTAVEAEGYSVSE